MRRAGWSLSGALVVVGCGSVASLPDSAGNPADARVDGGTGPDARPPDAAMGAKRVFVTSVRYNGNLGGLTGADQKCNTLAGQAGFTTTFRAWLSDGLATGSPAVRLTHNPGPYVLVDGRVIAASWTDLTDGTLVSAIDLTERGLPGSGGGDCFMSPTGLGLDVWSATRSDGSPGVPNVCGSPAAGPWVVPVAPNTGGVGVMTSDARWSYGNGCVANCSTAAPLYCFEQ